MVINGKVQVRQFNKGMDSQYRDFAEVYTDTPLSESELKELTENDWEVDNGHVAIGMNQLTECIYRFVSGGAKTLRERTLEEENARLLEALASVVSTEQAAQFEAAIPALARMVPIPQGDTPEDSKEE